jgi:hypothetical protein
VSKPWIFVSSFDPATGIRRELRRYDEFPQGAMLDTGDVQGFAGTEMGLFATSLQSWDASHQPRNQVLLIGHVGNATSVKVDLGWPSGMYYVTDIGWDGEAFAVHARRNATGELFLTRVDPQGRLILSLVRYGSTPSPGGTPLGHRLATGRVSGMTYLLDTPALGVYVSGHDRAGQPFPWTANGPFVLTIPELADPDGAALAPGVVADAQGGAWITWSIYAPLGGFHKAAAHITAEGNG